MMARIKLRQKCEFCARLFLFKKQLLIHQERVHDKELPYACARCQRAFFSAWDLNDHIMNHFAVSTLKVIKHSRTKAKNTTEQPTEKRFLKIVLSRLPNQTVRGGTKSGLKIGYRSGPKNYFKPSLKTFERIVSRSVNHEMCAFPCKHCEKQFLRPRQLTRHILTTHVKKKVYACTKCDKVFNKRADEVFHLMTHFSETSHLAANKDQSQTQQAFIEMSKDELNDDSPSLTTPIMIAPTDSVLTTSALELHDSYEDNNIVTRAWTSSEVSCNSTESYTPSVDDMSDLEMKYTPDLFDEQLDIKSLIPGETINDSVDTNEPKKRGRKPGSKGLYKCTSQKSSELVANESVEKQEPKKRGRKPGSYGPYKTTAQKLNKLISTESVDINEPKKRGRKPGSKAPYKSTSRKFYKSVSARLTSASKKTFYKKVNREIDESKLTFACTQCEKKFLNSRQLKKHVLLNHTEKRVYSCSQCDQVFNRSALYSAHFAEVHCGGGVVSEDGSLTFACPVCNKSFNKMYYLNLHFRRSHTDSGACLCTVCGKRFSTPHNLRCHESVHNGVLPFACVQCGRRYIQAATLNRHIRQNHSNAEPYTCQQCDKTFVLAFDLKLHMGKHAQMHICTQCGRKFAQRIQLKRHEVSHSSEKPFPCKKCGKRFGLAWYRTAHIKTMHSNDSEITGERIYDCKQCPEKFFRIWDLNRHLKTIHSNSLPHVCSHCGEGFVSKGRLKIHEAQHTGKLKCICSECGKSYFHPSALKIHVMRSHSGERPHRCDQCGLCFSTAGSLKQHKSVHT